MSDESASACSVVDRLDLLVDSLLDGSLVPFLGAGVSVNARILLRHGDEKITQEKQVFEPVTSKLGARLKRLLANAGAGVSPSFKMLVKGAREVDLAQLSELVHLRYGPYALCEQLQIHLLTELEPLPAHVYLACLAREGLIRQVITTNYDTCLEEAFSRTLGRGTPRSAPPPLRPRLAVIRDLEEYRAEAGRLHTGGERRCPRLQVYKINGCAQRYRDKTCGTSDPKARAAAAEEIILTERQLQDFRARQWARDLLRVTARSRVLLFSGFGTDEPQVRHTMLLLMEEFQQGGSGEGSGFDQAEEVAKLPNAPFVQVFGQTLSFNQLQPLHAFAAAHLRPRLPARAFGESEQVIAWRTATGEDGPALHNGDKRQLPADLFFNRLYQRTWGRLLKQHCADSSPFPRWLRGLVGGARSWRGLLGGLLRWLYPECPIDPPLAFGRFPGWIALTTRRLFTAPETLPAPLWCWLHAQGLPDVQDLAAPPYPCLREDSLRILGTLFLLYLLFGELPAEAPGTAPRPGGARSGGAGSDTRLVPWWRWIQVQGGSPGLSLVVPTLPNDRAPQLYNDALGQHVRSGREPGLILHLVSEQAPERQHFSSAERPLVYQIAIPSLEPASGRSRAMRSADGDRRRALDVRRVPLDVVVEALLRPPEPAVSAAPAPGMAGLAQLLCQRAEQLRRVFAQAQPHKSSRLRPDDRRRTVP